MDVKPQARNFGIDAFLPSGEGLVRLGSFSPAPFTFVDLEPSVTEFVGIAASSRKCDKGSMLWSWVDRSLSPAWHVF